MIYEEDINALRLFYTVPVASMDSAVTTGEDGVRIRMTYAVGTDPFHDPPVPPPVLRPVLHVVIRGVVDAARAPRTVVLGVDVVDDFAPHQDVLGRPTKQCHGDKSNQTW